MVPVRSNLNKETCSPVSSNCIIWQGPDLPCIGLCREDSISEVTYRLAVELCNLKDNFDFTDVDLECILKVCTTSPEPEKTLGNILNLIINKVCCLSDIVKDLGPNTPDEPLINIANCPFLKPYTDSLGNTYNQLPHSEYTYYLGTKICELKALVDQQAIDIANIQQDIINIKNTIASLPGIPQVTPDCITGPGVTPGTPVDVDILVNEFEKQYCEIVTALGTAADITTVKSKECGGSLNTQPSLANRSATMSAQYSATGWVLSPTNMAKSLVNLWITVCDLRSAVKTIQDNCCKITCDDIIVDASTAWTGSMVLLMNFKSLSYIPTGWYDCNQDPLQPGNLFTFTDGNGFIYQQYIFFRNADPAGSPLGILDDPTYLLGYSIDFTGTGIDPTTGVTVTSNVCLTNGETSCVKCITLTIPPYASKDCCTITNTSTSINSITYKICPQTTTTTTSPI